ncbi:response regulator transcription factor [bacterium]|nr:MAG: response regulator transcription factor [bacterium]
MSKRILVVEDEPEMRSGIADNLEFEGYAVVTAENGAKAWEILQKESFDLVISDVMMPEISGFDLAKLIQKADMNCGLIMLTARAEEMDKVRGLELGADDYISKPFSLREFLARVKSVLRRYEKTISSEKKEETAESIEMGNLVINKTSWQVRLKTGEELSFSHKEIEILLFFDEHAGQVVSRDDLLTHIWGYENELPTTRTVDNFILRLRQKMEPSPSHPRHLITVHGTGYKYIR